MLPAWAAAGWKVTTVAGRNPDTVRRLARRVGAKARLDLSGLAENSGILLLAVPDESIAKIASRLADGTDWTGSIVLHHAGAYGPELLAPLAAAGAATGLLHPLQVMPSDPPRPLPEGTRARCEGAPVAQKLVPSSGSTAMST